MSRVTLEFMRLGHNQELPLPQYMSEHAAGMDIPAAVEEPLTVAPGHIVMVPTGLVMALPPGYEGQVRPRSGLAVKHGLTVVNAPGTIDADYRGEVKVALINLGTKPVTIQRGDRVAQLIIAPVTQVEVVEKDQLSETRRGEGGFGSTGG